MKAEFELTVDAVGNPVITFKHHDKSSDLEQKLLRIFIHNASKKGLLILNTGGYCEVGTNNSHENYAICHKP